MEPYDNLILAKYLQAVQLARCYNMFFRPIKGGEAEGHHELLVYDKDKYYTP